MISSDQRPPGEDWLVRRIVELERQVRELQAGRRLEAATIGAGGLTVKGGSIRVLDDSGGAVELSAGALRVRDSAGNVIVELGKAVDDRYGWRVNNAEGAPQIRAGELAGGGYGLEAVNSAGELVSLLTLAFGMRAASAPLGPDTTTSALYVDLDTYYGPELIDVEIGSSGRCLVILSADINAIGPTGVSSWAEGYMSFAVTDAPSFIADPSDDKALSNSIFCQTDSSSTIHANAQAQSSRGVLVTGLSAGPHTFTAKYRVQAGTVDFSRRTLAVMPF